MQKSPRSMRKLILLTILLTVILLFFLPTLYGYWLTARGYHVGYDMTFSEDLAKEIVTKHENPQECGLIRSPMSIGDVSEGELRIRCIQVVAELSKDPTICEILMPNEFGLGCVANIWGPLIDKNGCYWDEKNEFAVRCFIGKENRPVTTICDYKNLSQPDECWHRMAFKQNDATMCDNIKDLTLRSICTVRINTWLQYPQLRNTVYFTLK